MRQIRQIKNRAYNPDTFFLAQSEFDFHDFEILNAYDIEKLLSDYLEDCYALGYKQVLVITGKGKVVRPAVNRLLKQHKLVLKHNLAGYFNGQDGAFEVQLID